MIELFEKILYTNIETDDKKWEDLFSWLKRNNFPSNVLPYDYLLRMRESNGGNYINGEREYQFLALNEVIEYYEAYIFSRFMPYAFPFAMDGYGNLFIFNLRTEDNCVYAAHTSNMGWREDECFRVAKSFKECLTQKDLLDNYIK